MTVDRRDEHSDGPTTEPSERENLDPRDTDHPTGDQQAAENADHSPG